MRLRMLAVAILAVGAFAGANSVYAQGRAIDVSKSTLKIRALKSGAFSAFAHDHEIEAPIEEGKIDEGDPAHASVQLRVSARKMRVLDPGISADKRAEIQRTMQGATVLDVEKFPEISYESTSVTGHGEGRWQVQGELALHGKKQPVA